MLAPTGIGSGAPRARTDGCGPLCGNHLRGESRPSEVERAVNRRRPIRHSAKVDQIPVTSICLGGYAINMSATRRH